MERDEADRLQAEMVAEFNTWINDRVRNQQLSVRTMGDLMAAIYLRVRMHLDQAQGMNFVAQVVKQIERHIEDGDLVIILPGGDSMRYIAAEELDANPGLREMMMGADKALTDELIEEFFNKETT